MVLLSQPAYNVLKVASQALRRVQLVSSVQSDLTAVYLACPLAFSVPQEPTPLALGVHLLISVSTALLAPTPLALVRLRAFRAFLARTLQLQVVQLALTVQLEPTPLALVVLLPSSVSIALLALSAVHTLLSAAFVWLVPTPMYQEQPFV